MTTLGHLSSTQKQDDTYAVVQEPLPCMCEDREGEGHCRDPGPRRSVKSQPQKDEDQGFKLNSF